MTMPALPAQGSTSWYTWATGVDSRVRNGLMFNVKDYGAVGDGTTNDTSAIQAAIDALDDNNGGIVWFPPGRYNVTTLNITTKHVTLDGPGVIYNGTVNVGVQTGYAPVNLNTSIRVGFDRSAKSSTVNAIHIANAHNVDVAGVSFSNYRALVHFPALSLGGSNDQHAARVRIAGVTTPSGQDVPAPTNDYVVYISANTTGGNFSVGDLTVTGCSNLGVRIAHIAGSGLDGLTCTGNQFFFVGYPLADTTKTSHIDLSGQGGFINITGNQLFEAGFESIKLSGKPRNVTVTGNHIAWSGQRDLRDAVSITADVDANCRGIVSGNNIELYTKAAVGVYGTGEVTGLTLGPNATFATNPNPTYYGSTTLPASFNRYTSAAGLNGQPQVFGGTGAEFGGSTNDSIGGLVAESRQRLGLRSTLTARQVTFSVAAANTVIGTFSGVGGLVAQADATRPLFGGLAEVWVSDSAPNHTASYLLNVNSTYSGRALSQVTATGENSGSFAGSPAFTFTISATGQLLATPIGSTSGTFQFTVTCLGNLRFT